MTSAKANNPQRIQSLPRSNLFPVIGVALFLTAIIVPAYLPEYHWLEFMRWAGLICLAAGGIREPSLTFWILFATVFGGEIGHDYPQAADKLFFLSDIFLRLIRVIVAPLILGSLISGIAGHGDSRALRRIGVKTLIYFEVVTTLALLIGVAAINLTRAGEGLTISASAIPAVSNVPAPESWGEFLVHVFPENLAKSVAENQILQIVIFAVLFGIALTRVPEGKRVVLLHLCESLTQAMFYFTNLVMYFAPFGVAAAMAHTVAHTGTRSLFPLAKLVLTAYGTFFIFVFIVLLPVALWARLPLRRFVKAVAEPTSIAFATSTSEAALPRAMEEMETFGVPRQIVALVIPAGYSFNMDGATLYLAIASIFVAQAAGIHLSWKSEIFMVFTLMLASKGMAGVPRAVLVVLIATAATLHLPQEPILLILGVDALIDTGRSALNVLGNCLACAVIARWEGVLFHSLPDQTG